jgi:hypothetical protein
VRAWRREREGSSYGLFQLYDKYHPQYRDDLLLHIVVGVAFLAECKEGRSLARAYSVYNSGSPRRSIAKGREVMALRDGMAMYLWRRMR